MGRKQQLAIAILFFGLYLEFGFLTFFKKSLGLYWSPVAWMLGGLLTCGAGFYLMRSGLNQLGSAEGKTRKFHQIIVLAIFTLGSLLCADILSGVFASYPVDPKGSDIIPSLEFYVRRLLSGETVYKPLPFDGYEVNPTYFPLLWAPYIFSEVLHIDYRWTAYLVFLIALFLYHRRLWQQDLSLLEVILKAAIPFLLLVHYILEDRESLGFAVELLPIGFYFLLTLSVFHRSKWIMAIGILLCLLSRYAFTFWLPIYLLIFWIERGFKPVFQVSLSVLAGVLLLYVLPFLAKDWTIFTKGLAYYGKTAETQWIRQKWQKPDARPHHLQQGLSYSIYFYDFIDGPVEKRLKLNRIVHISACALAAVIIFLLYLYYRKKELDHRLFLIIALKFYLLIFYGFFYVPFSYLFKLPTLLTLPILYHLKLSSKSSSTI
ncbi:MAG: hypothetical protein AAF985_06135 [Bacteroidota bacterium]